MKKLNLEKMENIEGGSCASSALGLGLSVAGAFLVAGPVGAGLWAVSHLVAVYNLTESCK